MANGVFNPENHYKVCLAGITIGGLYNPTLPGHFAADTVEVDDELSRVKEYAVFTVDEPLHQEYPHACVGTFRLPLDYVESSKPELLPE